MTSLRLVFFFATLVAAVTSKSIVRTLPGYDGTLPFHLETGYIRVSEEVNYFYYFVESQGNSSADPLLLWITGGPGCSSLHGFLYENGPLLFKYGEWDGGIPKLFDNPYAWTKMKWLARNHLQAITSRVQDFNIIYMDGPVGTGFSYSTTTEGAKTSDSLFSLRTYQFLIKWLAEYPEFKNNQVYIGGDGYSGVPIPLIVQHILDGIVEAPINLKGYMLGSPGTDRFLDFNTRANLAHQFGYIPNELFLAANASSNGNFTSIWLGQVENGTPLAEIKELVSNINTAFVLDASCRSLELSLDTYEPTPFPENTAIYFPVWCRKEFDFYSDVWVNDDRVKKALQVDQTGVDMVWESCMVQNDSIYDKDVSSVISYHKSFATANIRALIYSGDHDMDIPYIGTEMWIASLEMPLVDKWRVWSVDNETAGFTRSFQQDDFKLTFATVKGAGHFAPQYKIKECAAMINRWIADSPL